MEKSEIPAKSERRADFDWEEMRRRVSSARAAVEQRLTPSPEEQKRILRSRAGALAQEVKGRSGAEEDLQVLEFTLAYENYGVETKYVQEVSPLRDFTPLPGVPAFMLGIVNVRGEVLSVIDIKKLFDLPERGLTDLNKIIVVRANGTALGVLADAVLGVRSIRVQEIQPSLPTLTGLRAEYLQGVTPDRIVILNVEKVVSDQMIELQLGVESLG